MKTKMFLILVSLSLFSIEINAQTFICTDVIIAEYIDLKDEQDMKNDMLGSVLELEIFDNDIKISIKTQNEIKRGSKRDRSAILPKHKLHDYYELSYKGGYIRVKLERIVGYIKGLKLTMKNGDAETITIFKRKVS
jgi:hypothetical protein